MKPSRPTMLAPRFIAVALMLVAALAPWAGAAPKSFGSTAPADLAASVWHSPPAPRDGDAVSIGVNVYNAGGKEARASILDVLLDGALHARLDVPALAPGSYFVHSFAVALAAGTHTVEAIADATARIREPDESNNWATDTVDVAPRLADLVVVGATNGPLYGGNPLRFVVGVRNQGMVSAPATILRAHWDDGTPPTDVSAPALEPGETLHFDVWHGSMAEGNHQVRLEADANSALGETDESNNVFVHAFTVLPPQPDLVVMDLWAQPRNDTAGTQSLVATIANIGSATAGASTARFVVDGQIHDEPIPEMPRDAAVEVTITVSSNVDGYNVTVTADFGGAVAELDEENNSRSDFVWADGSPWAYR